MLTQQFTALGASGGHPAESLTEHLHTVHSVISARFPDIDRVALATYDPLTDALKTFVSSNSDGVRLDHYDARLTDVPSRATLAQTRQFRVVNDIDLTFGANTRHTTWLKTREYRSSFTMPVYHAEQLAGFLFFDSRKPLAFDADTASFLEVFGGLISQLYLLQLQVVHGIAGTVHVASGLARIRDLETGQHLERMAAYSQLMARQLSQHHALDDEFIEYIFLFAPLHDIGKVGIPDNVLLKPGRLDAQEMVIMRRHVEIGETIVDQMGRDLRMGNGLAFTVMRNIVGAHHERGDGSGYPRGLRMKDIPLEARIVAVADVYDALSNRRPYKEPWAEADIAAELDRETAAGRLDAECVQTLMQAREERLKIQREFADR
jgi:HD-GYP domain-containing protein (c-di-GMP phosphodiesterase class II)